MKATATPPANLSNASPPAKKKTPTLAVDIVEQAPPVVTKLATLTVAEVAHSPAPVPRATDNVRKVGQVSSRGKRADVAGGRNLLGSQPAPRKDGGEGHGPRQRPWLARSLAILRKEGSIGGGVTAARRQARRARTVARAPATITESRGSANLPEFIFCAILVVFHVSRLWLCLGDHREVCPAHSRGDCC